jgi:catechol 2,3-dioxygenase-like lactoylglutathione lyase family enzyme
MIRNIHHIGIVVRDFEKMLKFYSEAFGFKVLGTELNIPRDKAQQIANSTAPRPNNRIIMMQAGNCYLEIMGNVDASASTASNTTGGYVQLCFDVDDIDAEYARLKNIGMTFGPPAPVDFGHVKAVTGRDPEGNVIELVQTIHHWDCDLAELLPTSAQHSIKATSP